MRELRDWLSWYLNFSDVPVTVFEYFRKGREFTVTHDLHAFSIRYLFVYRDDSLTI